jgi:hypothetical protein
MSQNKQKIANEHEIKTNLPGLAWQGKPVIPATQEVSDSCG